MPGEFSLRHSRWRTWLRGNTPNVLYYRVGLAIPKARDCGWHEWYFQGDDVDACYHCLATRPHDPDNLGLATRDMSNAD
jgi:hypothetical protein